MCILRKQSRCRSIDTWLCTIFTTVSFYKDILIWSLKAVPGNAPRSSDKNITSTLFLYVWEQSESATDKTHCTQNSAFFLKKCLWESNLKQYQSMSFVKRKCPIGCELENEDKNRFNPQSTQLKLTLYRKNMLLQNYKKCKEIDHRNS